jgi:predicted adenine nucleotide alpha hydrolase (AANH) superfamily ATPase
VTPFIYYFNPNIYPLEEYEIRKNDSKRHAASLGIEWIDDDRFKTEAQPCGYGHEAWREAVCGLEHEPERGKRCEACFYYRLLATARKAQELHIPFFATTLASSRWKNLDQINAAGLKAQRSVSEAVCQQSGLTTQWSNSEAVRFWAQNWRKDGLQERRNELLKEYGFYNQIYCGCEFSMPPDMR